MPSVIGVLQALTTATHRARQRWKRTSRAAMLLSSDAVAGPDTLPPGPSFDHRGQHCSSRCTGSTNRLTGGCASPPSASGTGGSCVRRIGQAALTTDPRFADAAGRAAHSPNWPRCSAYNTSACKVEPPPGSASSALRAGWGVVRVGWRSCVVRTEVTGSRGGGVELGTIDPTCGGPSGGAVGQATGAAHPRYHTRVVAAARVSPSRVRYSLVRRPTPHPAAPSSARDPRPSPLVGPCQPREGCLGELANAWADIGRPARAGLVGADAGCGVCRLCMVAQARARGSGARSTDAHPRPRIFVRIGISGPCCGPRCSRARPHTRTSRPCVGHAVAECFGGGGVTFATSRGRLRLPPGPTPPTPGSRSTPRGSLSPVPRVPDSSRAHDPSPARSGARTTKTRCAPHEPLRHAPHSVLRCAVWFSRADRGGGCRLRLPTGTGRRVEPSTESAPRPLPPSPGAIGDLKKLTPAALDSPTRGPPLCQPRTSQPATVRHTVEPPNAQGLPPSAAHRSFAGPDSVRPRSQRPFSLSVSFESQHTMAWLSARSEERRGGLTGSSPYSQTPRGLGHAPEDLASDLDVQRAPGSQHRSVARVLAEPGAFAPTASGPGISTIWTGGGGCAASGTASMIDTCGDAGAGRPPGSGDGPVTGGMGGHHRRFATPWRETVPSCLSHVPTCIAFLSCRPRARTSPATMTRRHTADMGRRALYLRPPAGTFCFPTLRARALPGPRSDVSTTGIIDLLKPSDEAGAHSHPLDRNPTIVVRYARVELRSVPPSLLRVPSTVRGLVPPGDLRSDLPAAASHPRQGRFLREVLGFCRTTSGGGSGLGGTLTSLPPPVVHSA